MRKYFAIRIGDQVEIRVAAKRPRAIRSALTKVARVAHVYNHTTNATETIRRRMKLEQTFYRGGKVLGICRYTVFASLSPMPPDSIVEISRGNKNSALDKGYRL